MSLLTARPPLLGIWARAYRMLAAITARYLIRGEHGATAYLHGRSDGADLLPGLSDVDLTIVIGEGATPATQRVVQRWQRLGAGSALVGRPHVFGDAELREMNGHSVLTFPPGGSAYLGGHASVDRIRRLERPGLYGATTSWRRLRGPERRPVEPARNDRDIRAAAWLELVYWWRWMFVACVGPTEPRATDLSVKFVAEPARIWLWLVHRERLTTCADVVNRALDLMPEEEGALRWALDARRALPRTIGDPFATALPAMARISERIATELGAGADEQPTEVRLESPPASALRPLVDWRALACPAAAEELFEPLPGEPTDAALVGRLAPATRAGQYPALMSGDLIVKPAIPFIRSRMRAVQTPLTDPVSFALARGESVAAFSGVPGFSAGDFASRAVAEQAVGLEGPSTLGALFCAARAALFAESLEQGAPVLTLTVADTARRLAESSAEARAIAEEAAGAFVDDRAGDAPATVDALRGLVTGLAAFRGSATLTRAPAR